MNNEELTAAVSDLAHFGHAQGVLLSAVTSVLVEAIASLSSDRKAAIRQIVEALYDAVDGYSMPEGDPVELERAKESARGTIDLLFSGQNRTASRR